MWIQMQATYSGVAGLFLKGLKYDLPKSKVKLLAVKGKPIYRKCKPPW